MAINQQTDPSPCLGPVDLQPIISLCQHAYRLSKTPLIHRLKLCIFHVMQLLSENFCTKTEQHVYTYLLFSGSILRKIFSQIWYELIAYMATYLSWLKSDSCLIHIRLSKTQVRQCLYQTLLIGKCKIFISITVFFDAVLSKFFGLLDVSKRYSCNIYW